MRVASKVKGRWWVLETPDGISNWLGPYSTKAEAESEMRSVTRFLKLYDKGIGPEE